MITLLLNKNADLQNKQNILVPTKKYPKKVEYNIECWKCWVLDLNMILLAWWSLLDLIYLQCIDPSPILIESWMVLL